jgi:hypothetical protein
VKKKWVSEVVTIDEVKSWETGQVVTIEAGTGQGKSHFIKTHLYAHAKKNNKKILMLLHRRNCVDQFKQEMKKANKLDAIDIMTYQSIEATYKRNETFNFSQYAYIVSDEFHFFMSDAPFNKYTDISLNAILEQTNITRIFMSATGDSVKRYINRIKKIETKDYTVDINYNFIKSLSYYNNNETLVELLQQAVDENRKTILFIQSATEAYDLYKKFKNVALFNCSTSNDKHYPHVDKDKVAEMLDKERFEELILITTTCLDAGVNLKDDDLKYVICDVQDTGTLIQCIGRKRIMKYGDGIHLCIKTINNNQMGGLQTQIDKRMEMAEFLRKNTVEEYIKKYPREYDKWNIVYDEYIEGESDRSTKKVNDLMYLKCLIDHNEMSAMKEIEGEYGYCKYLARKFGFYDGVNDKYDYSIVEVEKNKMNLNEYLDSIVGEKLYKDNQEKLIEKIDLRVNGRIQKSYKKLNEGLEMISLPYIILPKKSGSIRYWIVEKIDK